MRRRDFLHAGTICGIGLGLGSTSQPGASGILVKVLGTAQDGGLPQPGCYCSNCLRAHSNPGNSRLIASLAILDITADRFFLVDATPDIRAQMHIAQKRMDRKFSGRDNAPDAVILTHAHIGHYPGLMFFGYEAMSTEDLPVYASARMSAFLANNGPWSQLVELHNIKLLPLTPGKTLRLSARIAVSPFQVPHRNEFSDTLGIRISGPRKRLLYIPDIQSWKTWTRSLVTEVESVDYALLDGTFFSPEELPGRDLSRIGHPFIRDSMQLLQPIADKAPTKILFTHLNHTNQALDPESRERRDMLARGFHLAREGMEFKL